MTGTKLQNVAILEKASESDIPSTLPVPSLRFVKGLPYNIDLGLSYSRVPSADLDLWGGELRWAILEGSAATPAVAVRGTYTKLSGVDQLKMHTYSADVSISKGFVDYALRRRRQRLGQEHAAGRADARGRGLHARRSCSRESSSTGSQTWRSRSTKTGDDAGIGVKLGFRF